VCLVWRGRGVNIVKWPSSLITGRFGSVCSSFEADVSNWEIHRRMLFRPSKD
jgi:hypothetical protein